MRLPYVYRLHTAPCGIHGAFYDDFIKEEMLVELQSSVRKEEDTFVKKIRDLETRLEQYEDNGAGDSSAQV